MYQPPPTVCVHCGLAIDLNKDYYRKHVQMDGRIFFWHNDAGNALKDCWHSHWVKLNPDPKQKKLF